MSSSVATYLNLFFFLSKIPIEVHEIFFHPFYKIGVRNGDVGLHLSINITWYIYKTLKRLCVQLVPKIYVTTAWLNRIYTRVMDISETKLWPRREKPKKRASSNGLIFTFLNNRFIWISIERFTVDLRFYFNFFGELIHKSK